MIGKVPDGWKLKEFLKIFKDDTAKKKKIPTNDYLKVGNIPVIDQGQKAISGYTNDIKALNEDQPIIIFGDHTRAIKYVDLNFAIGADGVKVLKNIDENSNTKYLYYTLLNSHIPNTGYNRHFKYLKRLEIPIPPLHQQEKIVKILDLTSSMIENQKELLKKYDLFLKSKFIEMFGTNKDNLHHFDIEPISKFGAIITGNTPSRSIVEYYNENFIEWIKTDNILEDKQYISEAKEYLSKLGMEKSRVLEKNGLLITCIAGSLKSIGNVAMTDRKITFNQQINAIQPFKSVNPFFLYWLIKLNRSYIQTFATSSMKKIITKGEFQNIKFIKPPLDLQNKFAEIASKIQAIKTKENEKLKALEELHGSLMQKAFQGKI